MWIESPSTGEHINFAEVYKIRYYEHVSSEKKELKIEIYFFSKDIDLGDNYHRDQNRSEDFYSGDIEIGLQLKDWLSERLGTLKFEAVETPPVEVVISEVLMKQAVEKCLENVSEVDGLLPEGVFLNPLLFSILDDQKTVDYLIQRRKAKWLVTDIHKSWDLDYEATLEFVKSLDVLIKSLKALGVPRKLSKYEKDALRTMVRSR